MAQKQILDRYQRALSSQRVLSQTFATESGFSEVLTSSLDGLNAATPVTLLLQDAEVKGVYSTTVGAISSKGLALLRFDGDSIVLVAEGSARGHLLDREIDGLGNEVLELELWSDAPDT
ncbi:MAG: hypothetical protein IV094_20655 [Vitreoscilla sp.]|nr:hypothetical protein [Vitreoscilla sp.]